MVVLQDTLERAAEAGVALDDVLVLRDAREDIDGYFPKAPHPGVPLLGEHCGTLQHQAQHGVGFQQRLLVMYLGLKWDTVAEKTKQKQTTTTNKKTNKTNRQTKQNKKGKKKQQQEVVQHQAQHGTGLQPGWSGTGGQNRHRHYTEW